MLRFPMDMGDSSPWDSTASAALMKGWISSIFMSGSRARGRGHSTVLTHHVLDDFVQHFRLDRLLHEMACAPLQRGHDVLLVAHRGDHDNARLGMLPHNFLRGLDAFHLWHGDVHEHDVGAGTLVLGYGGHAVARFAGQLSAECFDHARQVLAGPDPFDLACTALSGYWRARSVVPLAVHILDGWLPVACHKPHRGPCS